MSILSIQSSVAYGHVGNSAAVFPLQCLGQEVWPVDTVQFSNHTGYGRWRGDVFAAGHVREVVRGIEEQGRLGDCVAVLSGYLGDAEIGGAVVDAVAAVRAANPVALYCCDPVIGDVGKGVFVREGVPEFLAEKAIPAADIVTPNQFELEMLTGMVAHTLDKAIAAADALRGRGPRMVVVTSLLRSEAPPGCIETLLATADGAWLVRTPLWALPFPPSGSGDVLSALFLGRLLSGTPPPEALALAVSSLYAILGRTLDLGRRELALIDGRHEIGAPSKVFPAIPVG